MKRLTKKQIIQKLSEENENLKKALNDEVTENVNKNLHINHLEELMDTAIEEIEQLRKEIKYILKGLQ